MSFQCMAQHCLVCKHVQCTLPDAAVLLCVRHPPEIALLNNNNHHGTARNAVFCAGH